MRIHFFGATRTTTGSMYLLEVNGQRVLLECGLFQGRRDDQARQRAETIASISHRMDALLTDLIESVRLARLPRPLAKSELKRWTSASKENEPSWPKTISRIRK